ncbi:MAG: universal stress protein [Deltaproteobacteria bacterium]|nr:universal stress protein [Deltaproteobacteria bacterium]
MRIKLKKILCTTDFSDFSNYAIPYAIRLAKEFNAKLYVCHVVDITPVAAYDEAVVQWVDQQKALTEYAQEQLNQLIGEPALDVEQLVLEGHPVDDITRIAKEKHVDLAIAATHGRSGLKRMILGSVTERLIKTLPCPLMSIRSPETVVGSLSDQEIRMNKILVGCDFSADSLLAFEYALSLAQEFQSELHLVHVIEPPIYKQLFKQDVKPSEDLRESIREPLDAMLNKMIPEEASHWCRHTTALLAGQPHEELIQYALINHMDLIVLGIRGHRLVETLLVGSTTDRVIRQAQCPVLSVRPMAATA